MANHTPTTSPSVEPQQNGWFGRFLNGVEFLGNLLPHPVTLFALLSVAIVIISGILGFFDVAVADPRPEGAKGREADGMIEVISLMTVDGFTRITTGLVTNFTGFAPLGTVLVALLGVSVAEHSGLLSTVLRSLVIGAKPRHVTFIVVLAGILSNTASELGYVVMIPLSAMIFHSLGRHPLAGIAAAFAGVSAGYSANLLIGTIDPLLAGITEPAAQMIAPGYLVSPSANHIFMAVSTFFVAAMGYAVTEYIVEPRLGVYNPDDAPEKLDKPKIEKPNDAERQGMKMAGWTFLGLVGLISLTIVPEWGILRHPETNEVANSPFLKSIVAFIFVTFAIPGFVYGRYAGTM
ncbi:MAG: AbgT family transporter, partial [Glaciecola sp.]